MFAAMEIFKLAEQIASIQLQIWAVIALLLVFVTGNILCMVWCRNDGAKKRAEPGFEVLWLKDRLEELVSVATEYLRTYPNNQSALYFLAKAQMARGQYSEATPHIERLMVIEPSMRDTWQPFLDEINGVVGG